MKPEQYKLVPVEPTPEMEQVAEKYWNDQKFKALSGDPRTWKGLYKTMCAAAPAVKSTFTVGTDLSDGKLTVVVMKHENGITWVIHSEVIQLAEQQPISHDNQREILPN